MHGKFVFFSRSRTQSCITAYVQNCNCGQNRCWSKHKNLHILQLWVKSICPNATWFANVSNVSQTPCFLLFSCCSFLTFSSQWRGATFRQPLRCTTNMSWRYIFCLGTYLSGRKMSEIQNVWKAYLSHISINKENGASVPAMARAGLTSGLNWLHIEAWSLGLNCPCPPKSHAEVELPTRRGDLEESHCRCNWFS